MPSSKASQTPRAESGRTKMPELDKRIEAHWQLMPTSEQRIAELLLNSPGSLVSHTATELAQLAKTSKAAVSRLIQRLGYASFNEARQQVRAAQDWGSPLYLGTEQNAEARTVKGELAQQFTADNVNLDKTWRAQDDKTLNRSVDVLCKANRVVILGYRNSAYLARYFATQLGLLRDQVILAAASNESLTTAIYGLHSNDLVVAVALRRRVPVLLKALALVREQGSPVMLLTDPSGLSIKSATDLVLPCHCQSRTIFDNYAAPMSLLNFLLGQVAVRLGDVGRARLRSIEKMHEDLNDLL